MFINKIVHSIMTTPGFVYCAALPVLLLLLIYFITQPQKQKETKKIFIDFTKKMKKLSRKIHKCKKFNEVFCGPGSYNKSLKEGKKFTYNYFVSSATKVIVGDNDYFVIIGKYFNNDLNFVFGTNEYYNDNKYNGFIKYKGEMVTVEQFINLINFKYLNVKMFCNILNVYYDVFSGFNDKALWHE